MGQSFLNVRLSSPRGYFAFLVAVAHGAVAETETAKLAISCFLFSCSLERPSSVLSYRDRRISAIDDVDDAAG